MTLRTEILLNPGDLLYTEGGENDCGYIIESGEIILYGTIDGKRVDIERRGPGSIVGELSVLTGRPRTVSVAALTECRAFRVSASQILALFEKLDPVLRACIDTSITFNATLQDQAANSDRPRQEVTLAPSTLSNAEELIAELRFENDLVRGLQNGEFKMVYQPIVGLTEGDIVGFEALMRWTHPEMGFVPPDRFIQAAERIGAIHELTDFALMEACSALSRLRTQPDTPTDLFASVNISGQDIVRPGFVDFLTHVIDLHNLEPRHIKLEVTETALIADFDAADIHFKRLRELGFGLSIDDFGTGYSNLGYLKSLPLTALKIDRAFAGDAHQNAVSRGIVRLLIALGKELGVDIIAEGLETIDDVQTLRNLGCRYAQGYYFHKPMAEAELAAQLQTDSGKRRDVA